MSALQILEQTVSADHHVRARESAKVIYRRVQEMLAEGESPDTIYQALASLYDRFRSTGDTVGRDAIGEVLDWFEEDGPTRSDAAS